MVSLVEPEDMYQRFAREFGGISLEDIQNNSTNPPLTVRNWQSSQFEPSTSINTPGAKVTMLPSSGKQRILCVLQSNVTFTGTFNTGASEGVTAIFTATFDDDSTEAWGLFGVTSASTAGVGLTNLSVLMHDNKYIKKIEAYVQSTVANSQVKATAQVVAHQA